MRRKPPTIRSVARNFQFRKSIWRTIKSTIALRGIPRTVPSDMNNGKVYAMPKLMLKVEMSPRTE